MNGSDDGIHTVDAIRAANAADTSRRDFGASGGVPGLLEAQSPPLHVVPLRNFEPDILEYAHRLEAELLVKGHTRVVRQSDAREGVDKSLDTQNPEQRRVEGTPATLPLRFGPDVRCNLDGPLVSGP
jgi:hypothetical protein